MPAFRSYHVAIAFGTMLAAAACQPTQSDGTGRQDAARTGPAPTPAPPFSSIDSASYDAIMKYARGLTYDGRTGVSDSQALAVGKPGVPAPKCPQDCVYGPVAAIHPEVGALGLSEADLKVGRVIGRIINRDTIPYEKFNLGSQDTVYVWADAAAGPRARFISSNPKRFDMSRKDIRMTIEGPHEPAQRYAQSAARFIWSEKDEQAWFTCQTFGCCRLDP